MFSWKTRLPSEKNWMNFKDSIKKFENRKLWNSDNKTSLSKE